MCVCVCVRVCLGTLSSFLASQDRLASEESMLIDTSLAVLESRMSTPDDASTLRALMRDLFPSSVRLRTSHSSRVAKQKTASSMLNEAIVTQLRASGLQPTDGLVSKVMILLTLL